MKISFGITTHNEGVCVDDLLSQLMRYISEIGKGDEIVILDDFSTDAATLLAIESHIRDFPDVVSSAKRAFDGDFAAHKNHLNSLCKNDYIFQLDADERPTSTLLDTLRPLLQDSNAVELFWFPRINVVHGITADQAHTWRFTLNENQWVNFPDYQGRLYRNREGLRWEGRVHERLKGATEQWMSPTEEAFAIYHVKDATRQAQQMALYDMLMSRQSES